MTSQVFLSIDGVAVKVSDISISSEMGRAYDVATFVLDYKPVGGETVEITIGDTVFVGFVYHASRSGKNAWSVDCRSDTARLTTPFDYPTNMIAPARRASDLMQIFAQRAGIEIEYNSAEIDFGWWYQRSGTMLDDLMALAAVTGSEVFCVGGRTVVVRPHLGITDMGYEIAQGDYYDYLTDESVLAPGMLGRIVISDGRHSTEEGGGDEGDLQSAEISIDECGRFSVIANFDGARVEGAVGPVVTQDAVRTETVQLDDQDYAPLGAFVKQLNSVYVNGNRYNSAWADGAGVSFGHRISGRVDVEYITAALVGRARGVKKDLYIEYRLAVREGCCGEIVASKTSQGNCNTPSPVDPIGGGEGCGKWLLDLPDPVGYTSEFFSVGARVDVKFYYDDATEKKQIGFACSYLGEVDYTITGDDSSATPCPDHPGYKCVTLDFDPVAIVEFSTSTTNNTGYVLEGRTLRWSALLRHVKFAYTTRAHRYKIDNGSIDASEFFGIYAEISPRPSGCWDRQTVDLVGPGDIDPKEDPNPPPGTQCSLPKTISVNVAEQLGMTTNSVVGKSIHLMPPRSGTFDINALGYVDVTVDEDGRWTLDCAEVRRGAKIYIDVNTGAG